MRVGNWVATIAAGVVILALGPVCSRRARYVGKRLLGTIGNVL